MGYLRIWELGPGLLSFRLVPSNLDLSSKNKGKERRRLMEKLISKKALLGVKASNVPY